MTRPPTEWVWMLGVVWCTACGDSGTGPVAPSGPSSFLTGTWQGAVLSNPRGRRVVAQLLGAAYIDDWRLMNVNKDAIDQAAEALIVQGELVGDEISGLLDSVGLRTPTEGDPYPQEIPLPPVLEPLKIEAEQTA